jgi:hypothetical protein
MTGTTFAQDRTIKSWKETDNAHREQGWLDTGIFRLHRGR